MKKINLITLITLFSYGFTLSCSSLGIGTGGSSSDSDDFSNLSYAEAADQYLTTGQNATAITSEFAEAHNAFLTYDPDTATDAAALEAQMDAYTAAADDYTDLIEDLSALDDIVHPDSSSSSLAKYAGIGSLGLDDLLDDVKGLSNDLGAKKAECEALFALVPSLPSSTADFEKLENARRCVREAQQLAVLKGFDAAVVNVGGGTVGSAAGAGVVIYLGGSVLSGGGLIVIGITGFVGSKIASYLFTSCTSTTSNLVRPGTEALENGFDSCAMSSAKGTTGQALPLRNVGTGSLQVFVEDCAPVTFGGLTVVNGQTVSVTIDCKETDDDLTEDEVDEAGDDSTAEAGETEAGACADIVNLSLTTSPADPGPTDNVTASVATLAPANGCSVSYSVSGTDGYSASGTLVTDSGGAASFSIPASNQEGIVDTVTVSETASGLSSTITYTF